MKWNYGIFQKLPDGGMGWVKVVESLKKVEQLLNGLDRSSTRQYYAYDLRTMEMVAPRRLARGPDRARTGGSVVERSRAGRPR